MADKPFAVIVTMMEEAIAKGRTCHIKWTCPKCGDRCINDNANTVTAPGQGGYRHTEREDGSPCGGVYEGNQFGLLVMGGMDMLEELLERARKDKRYE